MSAVFHCLCSRGLRIHPARSQAPWRYSRSPYVANIIPTSPGMQLIYFFSLAIYPRSVLTTHDCRHGLPRGSSTLLRPTLAGPTLPETASPIHQLRMQVQCHCGAAQTGSCPALAYLHLDPATTICHRHGQSRKLYSCVQINLGHSHRLLATASRVRIYWPPWTNVGSVCLPAQLPTSLKVYYPALRPLVFSEAPPPTCWCPRLETHADCWTRISH